MPLDPSCSASRFIPHGRPRGMRQRGIFSLKKITSESSAVVLTQEGKFTTITAAALLRSTGGDPYLRLLFSATSEDLCRQNQSGSVQRSTLYLPISIAVGEAGGNGDDGAPTTPGTYSNTSCALHDDSSSQSRGCH